MPSRPLGQPVAQAVSPRLASASLLPFAALLMGSLSAVWLSVRTGETTSRFGALELPVLRHVLVALVIAAVAGVLVEGVLIGRWPLAVPAVSGSIVLVLAAVMLMLEEVAASLIPTSFLPASVRRLTVDVYGGLGIWLAVFACVGLVAGSRTDGGAVGLARTAWSAAQRLPLRWLAAFSIALAAGVVAGWVRYQPWASGTAGPEHVEVPGWSLPVIGPASLIVVVVLGISAVILTVHRSVLPALLLASAGWALSFLAAVAIVAASTLARVEIERYLPDAVEAYGPSVQVRWGAWLMFIAGVTAAACGMAFVYWVERDAR